MYMGKTQKLQNVKKMIVWEKTKSQCLSLELLYTRTALRQGEAQKSKGPTFLEGVVRVAGPSWHAWGCG